MCVACLSLHYGPATLTYREECVHFTAFPCKLLPARLPCWDKTHWGVKQPRPREKLIFLRALLHQTDTLLASFYPLTVTLKRRMRDPSDTSDRAILEGDSDGEGVDLAKVSTEICWLMMK